MERINAKCQGGQRSGCREWPKPSLMQNETELEENPKEDNGPTPFNFQLLNNPMVKAQFAVELTSTGSRLWRIYLWTTWMNNAGGYNDFSMSPVKLFLDIGQHKEKSGWERSLGNSSKRGEPSIVSLSFVIKKNTAFHVKNVKSWCLSFFSPVCFIWAREKQYHMTGSAHGQPSK